MVDMSQSVESFGARNEANFKLLMSNTFSRFRYKVDINDTVFGESMKNGVNKEIDGTNVVTPKNWRLGKKGLEFLLESL